MGRRLGVAGISELLAFCRKPGYQGVDDFGNMSAGEASCFIAGFNITITNMRDAGILGRD